MRKHFKWAMLVIPYPVILVIVYIIVFRLLNVFTYAAYIAYSLDDYPQFWLAPAVLGMSPLILMHVINIAFFVYILLNSIAFATGPNRRKRDYWVSYIGSLLVLALLQVVLFKTGNLSWSIWHYQKGDYLRNSPAQAIEHYSEVIRRFPDVAFFGVAYLCRAHAHRSLEEYQRAIDDYTKAIQFKSKWWAPEKEAVFYCGRSIAYSGMGDHERAAQDFEEAMRLLEIEEITLTDARDGSQRVLKPEELLAHQGAFPDGDKSPPALKALLMVAASEPTYEIMSVLGNLRAAEAVPVLLQLLERDDVVGWPKGDAVIRALNEISDPQAVKTMLTILKHHRSEDVRAGAAIILASIGDERAIPGLLEALDSEKKWHVRYNILLALYKFSQADAFFPVLLYPGRLVRGRHEKMKQGFTWAKAFLQENHQVVAKYEKMMAGDE